VFFSATKPVFFNTTNATPVHLDLSATHEVVLQVVEADLQVQLPCVQTRMSQQAVEPAFIAGPSGHPACNSLLHAAGTAQAGRRRTRAGDDVLARLLNHALHHGV
jgi:hypothetical protein